MLLEEEKEKEKETTYMVFYFCKIKQDMYYLND